MRKLCLVIFVLGVGLAVRAPAAAQEDEAGCKDHPLFNRMPGFRIADCEQTQFDLKRFPVGPSKGEGEMAKLTDIEGAYFFLYYGLTDGTTKPSPLQIMRNFQNAAKKSGGSVLAEFPGWCKATVDETLGRNNTCIHYGTTMKFVGKGKETWAFVEATSDGEGYEVNLVEREVMKQDIAVNELRERLDKDGFIALYINFETGSATMPADSMSQLEEVAQLLKADPALRLEVGGHTDNVGTPESNQKLSEARAQSVVAALVKQGIAAARLTAKGYGQTAPIADNRTDDGRAKNRRVELVKK